MATIQRNQPCPCGSGTKYKKCCFRRAAPPPPLVVRSAASAGPAWVLEDDGLDELSNSVVDLVHPEQRVCCTCEAPLTDALLNATMTILGTASIDSIYGRSRNEVYFLGASRPGSCFMTAAPSRRSLHRLVIS